MLAWYNVNKVAGRYIVGRQNDIVPDRELKDAVLDFSLNSRATRAMHAGGQWPAPVEWSRLNVGA